MFPLRPVSLVLTLLLFLCLGFSRPAHCAGAEKTQGPLRVALLLETPTGDNDWNDSLVDGLRQAERELGIKASVITAQPGHDEAALQEMFRSAAGNNDLVLVASNGLHEVLRNNAANFRRTMFGCIDAGIRAPNIMSVTFADEQAAYLAGAAAAMLARQTSMPGISGRKIIGWITGEDCPAMRSLLGGFTEGARVIDPEVRVVNVVTGSFANAEAGRAAAKNLLDQGADVLVLASGMGNGPALQEVKARNAYAVGLNTDKDSLLPGHVLTSILKHPNKAVYEIIAAAASGHFAGKEILVRDLQNGGVDITSMEPFKAAAGKNLPPDMDRRLRELRGEILNGGIRLKSLRERTLCDCL
ncbi:Basic membrane lipoprotein [uncultured Desulfovibrio sp.]|uniref:Basic membrane lipoprotein n=1 Tax=uncultured Desulfovibrio sp. TaxID=167968 RepID=A0A212K8G7_9BACT|nr:BMP family ABC transporter substrate-binding protein [Desulfovibrio desulfuricans]MCB6542948.1 BMP family ABC transporter substrate-binding protein [Desulfovibrio desulfuricans]MCB6553957.1 BMP family ABC transporter substrate-binding protein [Desulfovibrio desulfuricans]MCB6565917.1 BMP family ABC transporter substrate-binding protein [Desulfovibrio desulfuricans]MCB7347001.1 BMP family ABC transporter substrate-binding protein [Desulfovibrio desulfuricans]MCQ4861963.1 BMP family ABC trans